MLGPRVAAPQMSGQNGKQAEAMVSQFYPAPRLHLGQQMSLDTNQGLSENTGLVNVFRVTITLSHLD